MTKCRNYGTSVVLHTYSVQTSPGLRSSRGSGRRRFRTGNPAARRRPDGGRTSSQPMPAQTRGQGIGRGEERRKRGIGWENGAEGLPLYRGRGEALHLHQEGGGGALGHPPTPTNPLGVQPLGFGAPGPLSLGRPRLLLSPMGPNWPKSWCSPN